MQAENPPPLPLLILNVQLSAATSPLREPCSWYLKDWSLCPCPWCLSAGLTHHSAQSWLINVCQWLCGAPISSHGLLSLLGSWEVMAALHAIQDTVFSGPEACQMLGFNSAQLFVLFVMACYVFGPATSSVNCSLCIVCVSVCVHLYIDAFCSWPGKVVVLNMCHKWWPLVLFVVLDWNCEPQQKAS